MFIFSKISIATNVYLNNIKKSLVKEKKAKSKKLSSFLKPHSLSSGCLVGHHPKEGGVSE